MTADLAARDNFTTIIGDVVRQFEEEGGTPEQINNILLTHSQRDPKRPTLLGIPLTSIRGITLDGRYWLEVYGKSLTREVMPTGAFAYSFRVAQAPGGKTAKYGLEQSALIVTTEARILGATFVIPAEAAS